MWHIIKQKYTAINASFVTAMHAISMIVTSLVQTVANTGLCPRCADDSSPSGGRSGSDGRAWRIEVGAGERQTLSDRTTLATSRLTAIWVISRMWDLHTVTAEQH